MCGSGFQVSRDAVNMRIRVAGLAPEQGAERAKSIASGVKQLVGGGDGTSIDKGTVAVFLARTQAGRGS